MGKNGREDCQMTKPIKRVTPTSREHTRAVAQAISIVDPVARDAAIAKLERQGKALVQDVVPTPPTGDIYDNLAQIAYMANADKNSLNPSEMKIASMAADGLRRADRVISNGQNSRVKNITCADVEEIKRALTNKGVYPSQARVAEKLGISIKTLRDVLKSR
jgi:hypothetical protein